MLPKDPLLRSVHGPHAGALFLLSILSVFLKIVFFFLLCILYVIHLLFDSLLACNGLGLSLHELEGGHGAWGRRQEASLESKKRHSSHVT
jgi:hypothetical protein